MSDWIRTADRLPECSDDGCSSEVIVCSNGEIITGTSYWEKDKIFMEAQGYNGYTLDEVSHWMPLPKLPDESEEK